MEEESEHLTIKGDDNKLYYPRLPQVKYKLENIINSPGDGINTYGTPLSIKPSESRRALNLCSRKYPSLCMRQGRAAFATDTTTPNAMGERNNQYIHVQDGTVWKYWNGTAWVNIQTGLTSARGKILDFVRNADRFTILMNGTDKFAWDGTVVTTLTTAPATNKFTVNKSRVYALTGTTINYSALNKVDDWTTANDAGNIQITNAKGAGSAITTYGDYVTIFTEFSMHQIYGTGPTNFQLIDIADNIGCISDRSIVAYKNLLLFVSFDGIYSFSGGDVQKISQKMDEYFKTMNLALRSSIVGGRLDDTVFFAIPSTPTSTGNDLIIKYNISQGIWNTESGNIVNFETLGSKLYGIDKDGKLWDMVSGTKDGATAISWYWESGPRFIKPSAKQTLSEVWVSFDLPTASTLLLYTSSTFDNDDWALIKTYTANADEQSIRTQIPINKNNNKDWYRLKFAGTGPCTIHSIEEKYRAKE